MSRDRTLQTTTPPIEGDILHDVYRRVVEVHYALAEADRVDEELHRWCLDKLAELLAFVDARSRPSQRLEALEAVARASRRTSRAMADLDEALVRLASVDDGDGKRGLGDCGKG